MRAMSGHGGADKAGAHGHAVAAKLVGTMSYDAHTQGKLKPLQREATPAAQLGAIGFYLAISAAMSFINKWALNMFPLPMTLMVLQMAAAVAILLPLAAAGLLKFNVRSWPRCRQLFGITLLYVSNALLSLGGLAKLNVPIYTTLKRLTPIFVLVTKLLLTRHHPPWRVSAAVLLIVGGCVVAGAGDLDWDLTGYCFAVGSSFLQALYLVLVEVQGAKGIPTSEMLYYNSVTALPLLLAVTAVTGELHTAGAALRHATATFGTVQTLMAIALCATGGIVLNFSMFLATVTGSALTMTLVGNIKTILVLVLGFFLLGGAKLTPGMALGILTTLAGGSWYSSLKFKPPPLMPATRHALPLLKSPTAAMAANHHNHHLFGAGVGGMNGHHSPRTPGARRSSFAAGGSESGMMGPFSRLGVAPLEAEDTGHLGPGAPGRLAVVTVTADAVVAAVTGSNLHAAGASGHHRHPYTHHPSHQSLLDLVQGQDGQDAGAGQGNMRV